MAPGYDFESEGFFLNQIVLGGSFMVALAILFSKFKQFKELLRVNWLLVLFLMYTLLSCFWSPFSVISLKRWIQFLGIVLVVMAAMSGTMGIKSILHVLLWITALSTFFSLVGVLVYPELFVWPNGQWIGLYTHKNLLGRGCMLALAVWLPGLFGYFSKIVNRLAIAVIATAFILLVGSQSATALVTSLTIIFVIFIVKLPVPSSVKLLFLPVPFLVIYIFFLNFMTLSPFQYVLTILGRDPTFSGRHELWTAMLASIAEHPLFGIGYNAFWIGDIGLSKIVLSGLTWRQNQAHNGYLDVANELGFVGLGIFVLVLVQSLKRVLQLFNRDQAAGITILLIILTLIIHNITETSFCRMKSLGWVAFLIALIGSTPLERKGTKKCNRSAFHMLSEDGSNKQKLPLLI